MTEKDYKVVWGQRTGEVSLQFAAVTLHVHYPHDDAAHAHVLQMIESAPQHDPYQMMAHLIHEPVSSVGTETRQPQLG